KADNYRAVASWKFVLVDLAAGLGVDHYSSSATSISFHDNPLSPGSVRTVVINPSSTREVAFLNGGLSLAALKLVGELGYPSAQGFTPNTAGRTRKSWRWRTPATGRAVRRWW